MDIHSSRLSFFLQDLSLSLSWRPTWKCHRPLIIPSDFVLEVENLDCLNSIKNTHGKAKLQRNLNWFKAAATVVYIFCCSLFTLAICRNYCRKQIWAFSPVLYMTCQKCSSLPINVWSLQTMEVETITNDAFRLSSS